MILSFTSDKWCAQALHTDPENVHRFYHVTLWVLAEAQQDAVDGARFVFNQLITGRLHYVRAPVEIVLHEKVYQAYARFSYALEIGGRIYDEPVEN
jgi:hypothetical protein